MGTSVDSIEAACSRVNIGLPSGDTMMSSSQLIHSCSTSTARDLERSRHRRPEDGDRSGIGAICHARGKSRTGLAVAHRIVEAVHAAAVIRDASVGEILHPELVAASDASKFRIGARSPPGADRERSDDRDADRDQSDGQRLGTDRIEGGSAVGPTARGSTLGRSLWRIFDRGELGEDRCH